MMIDQHVMTVNGGRYLVVLGEGCVKFVPGVLLDDEQFIFEPLDVVTVMLAGDVSQYSPLELYEDDLRLLIWLHGSEREPRKTIGEEN